MVFNVEMLKNRDLQHFRSDNNRMLSDSTRHVKMVLRRIFCSVYRFEWNCGVLVSFFIFLTLHRFQEKANITPTKPSTIYIFGSMRCSYNQQTIGWASHIYWPNKIVSDCYCSIKFGQYSVIGRAHNKNTPLGVCELLFSFIGDRLIGQSVSPADPMTALQMGETYRVNRHIAKNADWGSRPDFDNLVWVINRQ